MRTVRVWEESGKRLEPVSSVTCQPAPPNRQSATLEIQKRVIIKAKVCLIRHVYFADNLLGIKRGSLFFLKGKMLVDQIKLIKSLP